MRGMLKRMDTMITEAFLVDACEQYIHAFRHGNQKDILGTLRYLRRVIDSRCDEVAKKIEEAESRTRA